MNQFRKSRSAFTLVELLAAMTILTIMVLLISRIFADSTRMWQLGAKRVEGNSDGRAAVDFMAREIAAAIADGPEGPLALKLESDARSAHGMSPDLLAFLSAGQTAQYRTNYYRQVMQVVYALDEMKDEKIPANDIPNTFRVVRYVVEKGPSFTCYQTGGFPKNLGGYTSWNQESLAENVRTLEFWVYTTNGVSIPDYDSSVHGKPGWVEVYLELLGEADATKAALLSGSARDKFCNEVARRYVGRAYLQANGGQR